ncbi:MAG TPA: hypothetical protein VF331_06925 [Polyangiales bacterium]
MRIGVIGQAGKQHDELRRALELLLADPEVEQVIYLGVDGAVEAVVAQWSKESLSEDDLLRRGATLAGGGSPEEIEALLSEDHAARRLGAVRKLPDPPARAIEMLDKWIVLAVHDKSILDEDDVANAHVIVYGKSTESDFKRFGPRSFLTPGPLAKGKIGRLTLQPDGNMEIALLDLKGNTVLREEVSAATAKLVVTS